MSRLHESPQDLRPANRRRQGDVIKRPDGRGRAVVESVEPAPAGSAVYWKVIHRDGRVSPVRRLTYYTTAERIPLLGDNVQEDTMTKVTRKPKTTAAKKAPAKASKPKAPAKARRSMEDVRKLVPKFVKHLQGGGTMRALKAEFGFSDDGPIRQALFLEGYDSKGGDLPADAHAPIKATGAKLGAALIKERSEGTPWYALALRTGKSEAELRQIVADAGGETARVYRHKEPAAKAAKKAPAKKAATKKAAPRRKATAADPS